MFSPFRRSAPTSTAAGSAVSGNKPKPKGVYNGMAILPRLMELSPLWRLRASSPSMPSKDSTINLAVQSSIGPEREHFTQTIGFELAEPQREVSPDDSKKRKVHFLLPLEAEARKAARQAETPDETDEVSRMTQRLAKLSASRAKTRAVVVHHNAYQIAKASSKSEEPKANGTPDGVLAEPIKEMLREMGLDDGGSGDGSQSVEIAMVAREERLNDEYPVPVPAVGPTVSTEPKPLARKIYNLSGKKVWPVLGSKPALNGKQVHERNLVGRKPSGQISNEGLPDPSCVPDSPLLRHPSTPGPKRRRSRRRVSVMHKTRIHPARYFKQKLEVVEEEDVEEEAGPEVQGEPWVVVGIPQPPSQLHKSRKMSHVMQRVVSGGAMRARELFGKAKEMPADANPRSISEESKARTMALPSKVPYVAAHQARALGSMTQTQVLAKRRRDSDDGMVLGWTPPAKKARVFQATSELRSPAAVPSGPTVVEPQPGESSRTPQVSVKRRRSVDEASEAKYLSEVRPTKKLRSV